MSAPKCIAGCLGTPCRGDALPGLSRCAEHEKPGVIAARLRVLEAERDRLRAIVLAYCDGDEEIAAGMTPEGASAVVKQWELEWDAFARTHEPMTPSKVVAGYTVGCDSVRLGRLGRVTASMVDVSHRRRVCVFVTADDARKAWARHWAGHADAPPPVVRRVVRRTP